MWSLQSSELKISTEFSFLERCCSREIRSDLKKCCRDLQMYSVLSFESDSNELASSNSPFKPLVRNIAWSFSDFFAERRGVWYNFVLYNFESLVLSDSVFDKFSYSVSTCFTSNGWRRKARGKSSAAIWKGILSGAGPPGATNCRADFGVSKIFLSR